MHTSTSVPGPNESAALDHRGRRLWWTALAGYGAIQLIAWAVLPWLIQRTPPGDNYEQLRWAEHLAWGYDKHPPLPTMVLWVFEQVFPTGLPLTYALGALQVGILYVCVWWVVRELLDDRRAIVAVLLTSCITYYTNRVHFYNHNTGLLVAYSLSVVCALRAARTFNIGWFVLLGISWALGLLSKYQMVIAIACNGGFILWIHRRNAIQAFGRLVAAAIVCALLLVPHVQWLVENHFPSFNYAAKFVAANLPLTDRPADIAGFWLNQLMRVAPLIPLLALIRWLPVLRRMQQLQVPALARDECIDAFLVAHAWGPMILMSLLSLLFGTDLQMHWGTAFIWMFVPLFLRYGLGQSFATFPLRGWFVAVMVLQVIMLASYR